MLDRGIVVSLALERIDITDLSSPFADGKGVLDTARPDDVRGRCDSVGHTERVALPDSPSSRVSTRKALTSGTSRRLLPPSKAAVETKKISHPADVPVRTETRDRSEPAFGAMKNSKRTRRNGSGRYGKLSRSWSTSSEDERSPTPRPAPKRERSEWSSRSSSACSSTSNHTQSTVELSTVSSSPKISRRTTKAAKESRIHGDTKKHVRDGKKTVCSLSATAETIEGTTGPKESAVNTRKRKPPSDGSRRGGAHRPVKRKRSPTASPTSVSSDDSSSSDSDRRQPSKRRRTKAPISKTTTRTSATASVAPAVESHRSDNVTAPLPKAPTRPKQKTPEHRHTDSDDAISIADEDLLRILQTPDRPTTSECNRVKRRTVPKIISITTTTSTDTTAVQPTRNDASKTSKMQKNSSTARSVKKNTASKTRPTKAVSVEARTPRTILITAPVPSTGHDRSQKERRVTVVDSVPPPILKKVPTVPEKPAQEDTTDSTAQPNTAGDSVIRETKTTTAVLRDPRLQPKHHTVGSDDTRNQVDGQRGQQHTQSSDHRHDEPGPERCERIFGGHTGLPRRAISERRDVRAPDIETRRREPATERRERRAEYEDIRRREPATERGERRVEYEDIRRREPATERRERLVSDYREHSRAPTTERRERRVSDHREHSRAPTTERRERRVSDYHERPKGLGAERRSRCADRDREPIRDYGREKTDRNQKVRRHLLYDITRPATNRALFLNAVVDGDLCRGFTAATSNIICEGVGVAFDMATRSHPVRQGEETYSRPDHVQPRDIVRFSIMNTDFDTDAPILVSCDFDRLLAPYRGSDTIFLEEFCRLKKVKEAQLTRTSGRHICTECYPYREQRAVFVTRSRDYPRLYCHYHAVRRFQAGEELLIYLPFLVRLNVDNDRYWLSTLYWPYDFTSKDDSTSGRGWYLLARARHRKDLNLRNINTYSDAELLLHMSRTESLPWSRGSYSDPTNVVRSLQYFCGILSSDDTRPASEDVEAQLKRTIGDEDRRR